MAGIEISPELGPILRLPAPHDDILLTASREGDTAGLADVYNEPNIGKRLYSIPYPYVRPRQDLASDADLFSPPPAAGFRTRMV